MAQQMGGPLHDAAFYGRLEDAEVLLGHDANMNGQAANGLTPLQKLCKMLIDNGADIDAQTENGNSSLHLVSQSCKDKTRTV